MGVTPDVVLLTCGSSCTCHSASSMERCLPRVPTPRQGLQTGLGSGDPVRVLVLMSTGRAYPSR